jgi:hypothetical protein
MQSTPLATERVGTVLFATAEPKTQPQAAQLVSPPVDNLITKEHIGISFLFVSHFPSILFAYVCMQITQ